MMLMTMMTVTVMMMTTQIGGQNDTSPSADFYGPLLSSPSAEHQTSPRAVAKGKEQHYTNFKLLLFMNQAISELADKFILQYFFTAEDNAVSRNRPRYIPPVHLSAA